MIKKISKYLLVISILISASCSAPNTGVNINQNASLEPLPFKVTGDYISVLKEGSYKKLFIKGVNLGIATPGKQAGELDISKNKYTEWFYFLQGLGINTVRVYTLHKPQFYEALNEFNLKHKNNPLYVLHGIWLDEQEIFDFNKNTEVFSQSIKEGVSAVHGDIEIPHRYGKAYGKYKTNISQWVIGWIIGREVFPEEIEQINKLNNGLYNGKYLSVNGNGAEAFIAKNLDELIKFEKEKYGVQRPISFSSWPTLDPITHPTENPERSTEDSESVNLAKIENKDSSGGLFISYHAYPYFPDFINQDPNYKTYNDEKGQNPYLGYLTDLKNHYKNMPLVIAEYGVPSSWGNAHVSLTGMNHGNHDEFEQGQANARLIKNIYQAKCAGGAMFNIIDEWWKKTWVVNAFSAPYDRFKLWHNVTSPEQNFGLIGFKSQDPIFVPLQNKSLTGNKIQKIEVSHDQSFFYTDIHFNENINNNEINIGFDTYRDDLGESILPNKVKTKQRSEFSLVVKPQNKTAQLYVTQAYDLLGISTENEYNDTFSSIYIGKEQLFRSIPTDGGSWNKLRWRMDKFYKVGEPFTNEQIFEAGSLRVNDMIPKTSLDYVIIQPKKIAVKIPWSLLQVTDPTTLTVISDNRDTNNIRETEKTQGIAISVSFDNSLVETQRYKWQGWDYAPPTKEYTKAGYLPFKEGVKSLPDFLQN